jgi:hypothetical protein
MHILFNMFACIPLICIRAFWEEKFLFFTLLWFWAVLIQNNNYYYFQDAISTLVESVFQKEIIEIEWG